MFIIYARIHYLPPKSWMVWLWLKKLNRCEDKQEKNRNTHKSILNLFTESVWNGRSMWVKIQMLLVKWDRSRNNWGWPLTVFWFSENVKAHRTRFCSHQSKNIHWLFYLLPCCSWNCCCWCRICLAFLALFSLICNGINEVLDTNPTFSAKYSWCLCASSWTHPLTLL